MVGVNIADDKKMVIYTRSRERFASTRFYRLAGGIFQSQVRSIWSTYLNNVADHFIQTGLLHDKSNEQWIDNN